MNTFFEDIIAILKRPSVAVGILIVLCLILCGAYSAEGKNGPIHYVQSSIIGIFTPVSSAGNAAKNGLVSVADYIDNEISGDTLADLKEENAKLKAKVASMEKYKSEAERLQKLLNVKDQYNLDGQTAHVIATSNTA